MITVNFAQHPSLLVRWIIEFEKRGDDVQGGMWNCVPPPKKKKNQNKEPIKVLSTKGEMLHGKDNGVVETENSASEIIWLGDQLIMSVSSRRPKRWKEKLIFQWKLKYCLIIP